MALLLPPAGVPCSPGAGLLGTSEALDKTTVAGTRVGGLSALARDPRGDLLALSDNDGDTPSRLYTLRGGRARDVTLLRTAAGTPFTRRTLDAEGLAVTRDGQLLVASETEPSVRRFTAGGALRAQLALPPGLDRAPPNQRLEGLGLAPDGRTLVAAMEGSLPGQDGVTRMVVLRADTAAPGGFRAVATPGYRPDGGSAVSDVVVLGRRRLLVLERGIGLGGFTSRVFRARLRDGIVDKQLLVDLATCPGLAGRIGNVEGADLRGDRLTLVSDDGFAPGQVTRLYRLAVRP